MDDISWILFYSLGLTAVFFMGIYWKDRIGTAKQDKKQEPIGEEMDDIKLFKDESANDTDLKRQLNRERESHKRIVEELEQEINFLKAELDNAKRNYDSRLVNNI